MNSKKVYFLELWPIEEEPTARLRFRYANGIEVRLSFPDEEPHRGPQVDSYRSNLAQNGKEFLAIVDFPRNFQGETHVGNRANFLEILDGSGSSGLGEQTFELARLFPGRSFRRFHATATQDTAVNNGQPAGASVTLGGLDGLFLVSEDHPQ